jgi:predicted secreted Zn-dependent protease
VTNLTKKHGVRSWTKDYFLRFLLDKYQSDFNAITRQHCESVDRDLSMYRNATNCLEFQLAYDRVVSSMIAEYGVEKEARFRKASGIESEPEWEMSISPKMLNRLFS